MNPARSTQPAPAQVEEDLVIVTDEAGFVIDPDDEDTSDADTEKTAPVRVAVPSLAVAPPKPTLLANGERGWWDDL